MEKYKKTNALTSKGVYLKKRIANNRSRAQFIGIVYLLATIALAAVVCLPIFIEKLDPFWGVYHFWKVYTPSTLKTLKTVEDFYPVAVTALYVFMAAGNIINVLRSFTKLGWLFKKRASKTYGFNRNVYAMEDMGRIFSGSYSAMLSVIFVISVLLGATLKGYWELRLLLGNAFLILFISALGGGILLHFFAGLIGGKSSYFDLEDDEIVEQKRLVGCFVPFLRNFVQVGAVLAIIFFFLKSNTLHTVIIPFTEKVTWKYYVKEEMAAHISIALQLLTAAFILPLIYHAFNITEYNINGANGSGMKTFRVFAFFVFLTAGATAVCRYIFGEMIFMGAPIGIKKEWVEMSSIVIASIGFCTFLFEVLMRNLPKVPVTDAALMNDAMLTEDSRSYPHPDSPYAYSAPVSPIDEDDEIEDVEQYYLDHEERDRVRAVSCPNCGKGLRVDTSAPYHRCPSCGKIFQA